MKQNTQMDYKALPDLIGHEADATIYCRFASLSAQSLLFQQEELLSLERDLSNVVHYQPEKRAKKMKEVGSKIRQWQKSLLLQAQLFQLKNPADYRLSFVKEWVRENERIRGRGSTTPSSLAWLDEREDLVTLGEGKDDFFTERIVTELVAPMMSYYSPKQRRKGREEGAENLNTALEAYRAHQKTTNRAQSMAFILASLLLSGSIFALHYIPTVVERLAFITVFSVVFIFCLNILTPARRIEIFTAAVAFASVQVVFIGTSPGSG